MNVLLSIDIVHAFKSVHKVVEGFDDGICWSYGCVFQEDGVRKEGAVCSNDKYYVCTQVLRVGTNISAIRAWGFNMELYDKAKKIKWHSVIVKRTVVVGIDTYLWGNAGLAKEVQS